MIPYTPLQTLGLGFLKIHTWGLVAAAAFLIILYLGMKEAPKRGLEKDVIAGMVFYAMLGTIIGGRLFYVIAHYSYFKNNLLEVFKIWQGGMILYGGFLVGILFWIIYLRKCKVKFFKYTDFMVVYTVLGLGIARIGCFLNGCCFGIATSLSWGMIFPQAPDLLIRHPTQIYHALANFLIFFILKKRKAKFVGYVSILFLLLYSGLRFLIEFLRYYPEELYVLNLTGSQWISLAVFIVAIVLLWKERKKL